ncbi:MAG TPA: DNA repair protein RadC [Bacillota bacterium]|nr:DNA repair protein RadC [Bacillota bacterium]
MSKILVSFERVALVKEKVGKYELPKKVSSPDQVYKAITMLTNAEEEAQEVFGILVLNIKNKIVAVHEISRGILNSSMTHPREVFKPAILHNAAAIVCFHNHPSGDPEPSKDDILITHRLVEAGKIMGIEVFDHIIVGDNGYVSLKERGVI